MTPNRMIPSKVCLQLFLMFFLLIRPSVQADAPREVLVLLEQGFNGDEFFGPTAAFQTAGYRIVVASSRADRVPLRLDGEENPFWDVPVDLQIADVNPEDYAFLFVPGGYSPGFLEKDEQAVAVVRHFLEAGKPLGMVCHGPRVLLSNDLLAGRTWTGLFTIADEVADPWASRPGRYLDLPVVVDENLITARYPGDMAAFAGAFLARMAEAGGVEVPRREGAVALILSNHPEGWGNWHFFSRLMSAAGSFGLTSARASANHAEWVERVLGEWAEAGEHGILALDITAEDWEATSPRLRELALHHPRVAAGEQMRELLADREGDTVWLAERHIQPWTEALVNLSGATDATLALPEMPPRSDLNDFPRTQNPDEAKALLVLREGFDDASVAAWVSALTEAGHTPLTLVAAESAAVTGVNGLTLEADAAMAAVTPQPDQLIIAPGFFWPQQNPQARQAVQPDWVQARAGPDGERDEWLLAAREAGATLFLTGLDALRIGRRSEFEGMSFSASTQNRWSFGRGAGRFTDAPVTLTAERLITVRGASDARAALSLLGEGEE